ncbi:cytochrome c oxidase assembly protein [Sphingobium bisphenolivorans]|uniref:cytochrome c oxidase assembly protein n=1 Tax=Sphingobium bisphenolivorans TaxID=1335760 RepID=UPI0003A9AF7B|nr:cytochrome c oxidase assembly protein [Sphingobium bisphenolivorans]
MQPETRDYHSQGVKKADRARFVAENALQSAALIVWHMPALFDRAITSEGWHVTQHLSFMVTALLFWLAMLPRGQGRADYLTSALCLFITSMVGGGLGALMVLSAIPWYAAYVQMGMTPFGLSPGARRKRRSTPRLSGGRWPGGRHGDPLYRCGWSPSRHGWTMRNGR